MRSTFEQGDQDAARLQLAQLRPLAEELKRGQATFDEALQPLLEKDGSAGREGTLQPPLLGCAPRHPVLPILVAPRWSLRRVSSA